MSSTSWRKISEQWISTFTMITQTNTWWLNMEARKLDSCWRGAEMILIIWLNSGCIILPKQPRFLIGDLNTPLKSSSKELIICGVKDLHRCIVDNTTSKTKIIMRVKINMKMKVNMKVKMKVKMNLKVKMNMKLNMNMNQSMKTSTIINMMEEWCIKKPPKNIGTKDTPRKPWFTWIEVTDK